MFSNATIIELETFEKLETAPLKVYHYDFFSLSTVIGDRSTTSERVCTLLQLQQTPYQRVVRADLYDVDGDGTLHGHVAQIDLVLLFSAGRSRNQ